MIVCIVLIWVLLTVLQMLYSKLEEEEKITIVGFNAESPPPPPSWSKANFFNLFKHFS